MSDDLIFEEPPNDGRGVYRPLHPVTVWLAALREHPWVWARFPDDVAPAIGTFIRKGDRYGVAEGEYQTRTTSIGNTRRVHLYARYIGTPAVDGAK